MRDANSNSSDGKNTLVHSPIEILERIEALERSRKGDVKKDRGYEQRQLRFNKWLVILTGCLVLTSGILNVISWRQASVAEKAVAAAKTSADASVAAVKHSIESFRMDERAWIGIEPIKTIPFTKADGTFGASFMYEIYPKNVGKTVARDIVMRANCASSGLSLGDNADQIRRAQKVLKREYLGDNNRFPRVLAPNTVSPIPFRLVGQEPKGGAMYSFLIGRIEYTDAFAVKHCMTFCYFVSNARGELLYCKEGNEESREPEPPQEAQH